MTSTSFSAALSALDDDALRDLTAARPDAFFPTPPSIVSLATRLALPGSATKALRRLTAADLAALERLADVGAELEPVDAGEADLSTLRRFALVYGPGDAVRISPGVLSALPPGWRITDTAPENLPELLEELSAPERTVLDTLAASGGIGTTKMAAPDADPKAPIPQLIAKELLIRVDAGTVRLPRPVRDAVRGHTPRTIPLTEPEAPALDAAAQAAIDEAAATQGLDAVRHMRQLVMALLSHPVPLNKDGTVGVRASTNLTKELGFDPSLLITVGESAGLIGRGVEDETNVLAATMDALTWVDATLADQWAILLAGWVASPWRLDSTEGTRLLSQETHSPDVRHVRMIILRHGGDVDRILFHAPLAASGLPASLIEATVAEATFVGALAPEPSSPLIALLDDAPQTTVTEQTAKLVPPTVDTLIAQADMTILAPGPLEPDMAAFLESIAQLESPGLASVWRMTDASVKRALDAGRTAEDIHGWLADHVLGEVPQGIAFLVDDTARTHGAIRAGEALSYIRCADPALIATAKEKLTSTTGESPLRVLAPTVAISDLPLPRLMVLLQDAGLQPTAEDAHGAQINIAPEPVLVPASPSRIPRTGTLTPEQQDQIIARLRSGGTAAAAATNSAGAGMDTATTLETLRAAARGKRHVTLGYVDKNGRGKTMTVLPLSVSAGQVDALDESTDRVIRIALPRITKAVFA